MSDCGRRSCAGSCGRYCGRCCDRCCDHCYGRCYGWTRFGVDRPDYTRCDAALFVRFCLAQATAADELVTKETCLLHHRLFIASFMSLLNRQYAAFE